MNDEFPVSSNEPGESDCRKQALKYLARREYSVFELGRKLRGKGYNGHCCEKALERLVEQKLVSDKRYAQACLSSRVRKGYGPVRIRLALAEAGVDKEIMDRVLDTAEIDWSEQLMLQHRKKYGDTPAASYKEWVKRARYLNNRGFSSEMIQSVLEFIN